MTRMRTRFTCPRESPKKVAHGKTMIPIIMEPLHPWPPGVVTLHLGRSMHVDASDDLGFTVKSTRGYNIEKCSYFRGVDSEFEVLFRPLSQFRVVHSARNIIDPREMVSVERSGFPDMIHLEQVGDGTALATAPQDTAAKRQRRAAAGPSAVAATVGTSLSAAAVAAPFQPPLTPPPPATVPLPPLPPPPPTASGVKETCPP